MNCHSLILTQSDTLLPIRESYGNNVPMRWVRVHKLPDYAYFSHSVHLRAGVGCESCHGNIAQMEEVHQDQPLSMGWCLDCHRNPGPHLRDLKAVTAMGWTAPKNQSELAAMFIKTRSIAPPEDCSTCHR